jgi:hypothetical protein
VPAPGCFAKAGADTAPHASLGMFCANRRFDFVQFHVLPQFLRQFVAFLLQLRSVTAL